MKGDGQGPELPVIPEGIYTEREEIARGGLGRVLKVTDRSMGRVVALKELLPEADIEEARFVREALVTGRLEHPSIVPVYEAGRWPSGEPFYTMKLVSGRSLRDVVKETRSLPERLALLPNVIAVAEALAYAHSKQVIHRDVKPSNVICGQFGETMVIDWGLAKELGKADAEAERREILSDDGGELTQYGDVLGTPAYMAPEQARGEAVDARADVYALGALLYFVLTGAAPHEPVGGGGDRPASEKPTGAPGARREMTSTDFVTAVAMRPPVPLTERRADLPRELVAIVEKAMARDPGGRYPTARELADDLKAFQTGRLVSAHHYTSWQLIGRWIGRNRVAVAVAGVAAALLAAGGTVSVRNIIDARDVAETRGVEALRARAAEQSAREQAERRARELLLLQARASLERDPTAALAWLKTYPLDASGWDAARAVVGEAMARGVSRAVWRLGDGPISSAQIAPDGQGLAMVGGDGGVRVLDGEGGAWRLLGMVGSTGGAVAFSRDGRSLAAGGNDRQVLLFARAGGPPRVLGRHDDTVNAVAFSPDGRWVASASTDRTVRLWPVDGGAPMVLRGHELQTNGLSFSADGARLATTSEDATLRIWEVASGRQLQLLRADRSTVDVSFSPDGRRLAAATRSGVRIWDLATGASSPLGDRAWGEAYAVVWHRSGQLVTAGVDGLGVWDGSLGGVTWLLGHDGAVNAAAVSPDGGTVLSGGADGALRLWRLRSEPGENLREDNQPGGTGARPRISADGRIIAAPGQDGGILVVRGSSATTLRGHDGPVREIVLSRDGTRLASYGLDRTVRLWDLATGVGRVLLTVPTQAFRLRYAPDGKHLALTQGFEELDIVDVDRGAIGCVFRGRNDSASEFSPDGTRIAYADGYELRVGELGGCTSQPLIAHRGTIFGVAWRGDGRMVATAASDRAVGVAPFPPEAGKPVLLRGHDKEVYGVAFSPSGSMLASAAFDGTARLWDASDPPRLLRVLRGHDKVLLYLAFSPDGALLATAGADDTVRVWDVASGDMVQRESDTGLGGLAMSPDGKWLVSSGPHGVRRWPLDRRDAVPASPRELARFMEEATSARIVEDGRLASR